MPAVFDQLLDESAAAKVLDVLPQTLAVWRCTKRYPLPYIRIGRNIRYRAADLRTFLDSRTVTPVAVSAG